jgi:hypothetical protein
VEQAPVKPLARFLETTGSYRQVGQSQPDPVIIRCGGKGGFQSGLSFLPSDRSGAVQPRQLLERSNSVGIMRPAVTHKLAGLVEPPLELVEVEQSLAGLDRVRTLVVESRRHQLFRD